MTTYVAMLRAVNVGGSPMPMAELRAAFVDMGHDDARTYIQTGNVVFTSSSPAAHLQTEIETGLEARFGRAVPVVMRTGTQLARVLRANPLAHGRDAKKTHVTFLRQKPEPARVRGLDTDAFLPDEFRVAGLEVYVYCPNGYGRTKITNAYFERALKVPATTRNLTTVTKLAGMAT
jgi:uncharacterized protein (DUF1697 family)